MGRKCGCCTNEAKRVIGCQSRPRGVRGWWRSPPSVAAAAGHPAAAECIAAAARPIRLGRQTFRAGQIRERPVQRIGGLRILATLRAGPWAVGGGPRCWRRWTRHWRRSGPVRWTGCLRWTRRASRSSRTVRSGSTRGRGCLGTEVLPGPGVLRRRSVLVGRRWRLRCRRSRIRLGGFRSTAGGRSRGTGLARRPVRGGARGRASTTCCAAKEARTRTGSGSAARSAPASCWTSATASWVEKRGGGESAG